MDYCTCDGRCTDDRMSDGLGCRNRTSGPLVDHARASVLCVRPFVFIECWLSHIVCNKRVFRLQKLNQAWWCSPRLCVRLRGDFALLLVLLGKVAFVGGGRRDGGGVHEGGTTSVEAPVHRVESTSNTCNFTTFKCGNGGASDEPSSSFSSPADRGDPETSSSRSLCASSLSSQTSLRN